MDVQVIAGKDKLASYGIVQVPAVVAVHCKLKAEGEVPSAEVIKEGLKEL